MPTEIYVDGASAGNPGPSGIGIFIKHEGKAESFSIPIGMHTNQEAEFLALIEGMKLCATRGYQSVSFRTDSDIVERAADLEIVKNKAFQPFLEEIIRLKSAFPLFFIKWIPGRQNQKADQLAKEAIRMNDRN
ncbi:reverse transcriptase-like protein [Bacillus mojavensis]|uniref:reverse transcriptase-like protein n=1 Tax=Bacillus mojavensis TaxID=72360 RepID=UPI002DB97632|nr:reverse transcriptase-like protein [Bacillus mojavensis]MEC1614635.1 reverse transcriptase-like protein [Bacillus mojavensis]MEC1622062.1 reverse transcriptase-like protein [Bacillus mojavensis]MEC1660505.1 reverse transcriptase-like protein [Bacillus mojavensis]MEC1684593.1 reverse transcriptase-like protein [Bacillus mojavensis]MEC1691064.1 reverse transcriptase-like protein [Bacillus mojavensis]